MEFRHDLPERRPTFSCGAQATRLVPDELFQFGIEEEYFLSHSKTFAAPTETPDALFGRLLHDWSYRTRILTGTDRSGYGAALRCK